MIVALEDNLMFSVAIEEMAKAAGIAVAIVNTPQALAEALRQRDVTGILLDMRLVSDEVWPHLPHGVPVAAFGPHVDGAQFRQMRERGIRDVWPNSRLREQFPRWLARLGS
ncbi:MAG: hypothetical protein OWU84_04660 [Firmicutes bacterium]|nr:hypothetical protein [Bacillota bacterium]